MPVNFFKRRRRARVRAAPFPDDWMQIIRRNVPYYRELTDDEQAELRELVQIFLDEKEFIGCGGLVITEEIRVTIAAQACVLLLNRDAEPYPTMRSVMVYPRAFEVPVERRNPDGTVTKDTELRAGESWRGGQVVLSWDDVRRGAADVDDARNVVFHEFAHQLDADDGDTDGAPSLPMRSMYVPWARVLSAEYEALVDATEAGRRRFLRSYGATNPAEFFAVITEAFFERPRVFKRKHPEMYALLVEFYAQDPAARRSSTRAST